MGVECLTFENPVAQGFSPLKKPWRQVKADFRTDTLQRLRAQNMKKKGILKEVIANLPSVKNGYCRIKHRKGWLEYLQDGDTAFSPKELHNTLITVIDQEERRPRGEKLLFLRRKYAFTLMPDKTPYRTEEALERFIVVSNPDIFNQIPVGGGKESIDIGFNKDDSKFVFVELKPWDSGDSPLYAVVESLKNLVEYRIIVDRNIQDSKFDEIELMILAPVKYYQNFHLIDEARNLWMANVRTLEGTLCRLCAEFRTQISFRYIPIEKELFLQRCAKIYDSQKPEKQQIVALNDSDRINVLARENWTLLATGNTF